MGRKAKVPLQLLKGDFSPGKPKKAQASSISKAASSTRNPQRITPMYSVAVSNELFHNGNVEAWKRIIASYNAKYPALKVYIYYEGQRIVDINSLLKWGKVKHGSSIKFAIAGADAKDIAKLRRYLLQGASRDYKPFLAGPGISTLRLFG